MKTSKGTGQVKGQGTEEARSYRCQGTGQRAGEERSDRLGEGGAVRSSGSTIGQGVR